jgi:hypothetical protein
MVGLNHELPQRLAPGQSADWWLPLDDTKQMTIDAGIGLPVVRGAVITGAGKRIISKTSVDLGDPESTSDAGPSDAQATLQPKKGHKAPPQVATIVKLNLGNPHREGDEERNVTTEEQQSPDPTNEHTAG